MFQAVGEVPRPQRRMGHGPDPHGSGMSSPFCPCFTVWYVVQAASAWVGGVPVSDGHGGAVQVSPPAQRGQ